MSLSILLADLADQAHAQHVFEINIHLQEEGFVRHGLSLPQDQRNKMEALLLRDLRADPATRVFLCFVDDECVGILLCEVRYSTYALKPTLYCQDLWVRPEFRKRGFGRKLVEAGMQYVVGNNFARVELTTTANNQPAGALYRSLGFSCADPIADGSLAQFLDEAGLDSSKYAVLLKWSPK